MTSHDINQSGISENEPPQNLYTPAMLADLLDVPIRTIRRWQKERLLKPMTEVMQLPYFDYAALAIARQLKQWMHQGINAGSVRRQLNRFHERLNHEIDDQQLLERLQVAVEGKRLVLRQDEHLIESSGQMRMEFDLADSEEQDTAAVVQFQPSLAASPHAMADSDQMSREMMLAQAIEAEDEGDADAAIDWYRAVLASTGPDADICFQIAELLYRQGDLSGAKERYFVALELNATLVEARANLGCVLAETGQLELAVAAFEGTLEQHPDYADVHFHLARTYDDLDNYTAASEHWLRFLELAPESPWAEEAMARLQLAGPLLQARPE